MAKPRQPRAKPAKLPGCFWLASDAIRITVVTAGGVPGPCVRPSAGVGEEDENNGVGVDVVVEVAVEVLIRVVDVVDVVGFGVEVVAGVSTAELELSTGATVGVEAGGATVPSETVAPQSARELPLGQQPPLVQ